ncbi:TerC family protein [Paradevosia shaoguanensis]|uniref:TerC family protein n=1 Tax=Paradevosia shaoguanensis TaxID=1335043 RepID=UPI003C73A456
MIELLTDPNAWIALATLTVMEIVLGIDNIVFISVLVSRLPKEQADRARKLGLSLALIFRILLLLVISWIIGLTQPVVSAFGFELSWKDIILLGGGLFLIYKATHEMHAEIEEPHEPTIAQAAKAGFSAIIAQIIAIDLVFSIDSIVTAVGMAEHVEVMIAAVIIAVGVMFVASGPVARFVAEHPTTKMLALAFLLLIGVSLVADGLGFHIPKGYIYSAMAFSVLVEAVNIFARKRKSSRVRLAAAATIPGAHLDARELGEVEAGNGHAVALAEPAAAARPKSTPASRAQSRPKSAPRKPKTTR